MVMKKRPVIGNVILIEHDGRPTVWPVKRSGDDDMTHLLEIFETAKSMCFSELRLGGTLKLMDVDNNIIKECRGV